MGADGGKQALNVPKLVADVRAQFDPVAFALADAAAQAPSSSHAGDVQGEAETRTDNDAPKEAQRDKHFGGLGASEAARLRWERHRARQAEGEAQEADEHAQDAILVRVSIQTGQIIKRLAADAKKGNVQAARELRGWLEALPQDAEASVSALDKRTRHALLARLIAEIEEEDERIAAQESDAHEGMPPPRE